MAEIIPIKDGQGIIKNLVADKIQNNFVPVHTLASTVTGSIVTLFYKDGPNGWSFDPDGPNNNPSLQVATLAELSTRKSIIIHNTALPDTKCYIIVGGSDIDFGTLIDAYAAPPKFSFILEGGATYFGDYATAALKHKIFVPAWCNAEKEYFTIAVTEVY